MSRRSLNVTLQFCDMLFAHTFLSMHILILFVFLLKWKHSYYFLLSMFFFSVLLSVPTFEDYYLLLKVKSWISIIQNLNCIRYYNTCINSSHQSNKRLVRTGNYSDELLSELTEVRRTMINNAQIYPTVSTQQGFHTPSAPPLQSSSNPSYMSNPNPHYNMTSPSQPQQLTSQQGPGGILNVPPMMYSVPGSIHTQPPTSLFPPTAALSKYYKLNLL